MVLFKLEDTMFFPQYAKGHLRQLPRNALDEEILSADGATIGYTATDWPTTDCCKTD